jgi:membrane fusion protein (multidrug efflux system)
VRTAADLHRYRFLLKERAVPQQQYDDRLAAARVADAAVTSGRAQARSAAHVVAQQRARLGQAQSRLTEANKNAPRQVAIDRANVDQRAAAIRAAEAAVAQARLNLEYTRIVAPFDGIVGRRTVEVGMHIEPAQQLLAIVDIGDLWVTANFKETQLRHMRAGARATVRVDAFGRRYDGWVESLGAASGSRFSLFPPENATGNYVKVVQRLPVRIRLKDPDRTRLRPGMSVEPRVYLR